MNGPVSDEQEDVDSREEPMETSITEPGGKDGSKQEMDMEEDSARPEGVVRFVVKDFSRLKETILSDPIYIRNLPWRLMCIQRTASIHGHEKVKTLAIFLQCNPETESISWSCNASAQLVLVNQKNPEKSFKKKIQHLFFAKENDWGFSNFKEWSEILNTDNGFLVDDTIIVEAHVVAEAPHGVAWDSKKHTGYVGLKNQGATCYMNSLLQTLFFTNKLRTAVYHMPTTMDDPQRSVAFNLQRVFYELQFSDKAVGTKKLTRSFGWETLDSFMQHDVQELCRVLLDNMESKMKGTCVEGVIPKLLEGKMCSYIKCTNVDYVSSRIESFYDIQLNVKGKKDIYVSFKEYIAKETLDGDNKYDAGDFGMQEAEKGVIFHTFPTVLHLQLMRFQYDPVTDANVKINDRYEFYEKIDLSCFLEESRQTQATYTLHAVLVHSGDNHGGHYVVYINPKGDGKWCKFDDDVVSLASKQEAIDHNFGGYDDDISVKYCTNAYMLVYIKDSCLDDVLDSTATEIPKELEEKLKEEKRVEAQRRKERSEAHLYMNIEVVTEDQFCGHQGNDLFDSTPGATNFKVFKVLKEDTLGKMMEQLANALGYKPNQIRPWPFQSRKNNTYRVGSIDMDACWNKKVMQAIDNENECTIFIETTHPSKPNDKLPSFDDKGEILIFFKYYDPRSETMSYCGHAYIPMADKISTLLPMLCERAQLPKDTPLMLFEEVRPGLTEHFKDLNTTFEDLEDIMDGDIFCFQRKDIDLDEFKLRTCMDYFRDYHNRMDVTMCDKNSPNDPGFNVTLSSRMTYTQMAEKVAWYLDVDPRKIQFFKAQVYGGGLPGNPIRCTYEGTLRDLMMYSQKSPKKLFYQLLSIPIEELENKKQVKCIWTSMDLKEQKELVLFPDKNGNVGDLFNEAKKHIELSEQGSGKLRLLMVLSSKIQEVLHADSDLEMFGTYAQRTYRIEEIPVDEDNMGEDEALIPVAHFQKDTYQTFGTPFLIKICDREKFSNIMDRVKQKLDIPDKEFEKVKFALVRSGRQVYLQDEGDKQINMQDFLPSSSIKLPNNSLSRPWLGLDHVDKAPKKSRYCYLERSIKILN